MMVPDVLVVGFLYRGRLGLPLTILTTAAGLGLLLSMRAFGWV